MRPPAKPINVYRWQNLRDNFVPVFFCEGTQEGLLLIKTNDARALVDRRHVCWVFVGCWCDFLMRTQLHATTKKGSTTASSKGVKEKDYLPKAINKQGREQRSVHELGCGRTWQCSRASTQTPYVGNMKRQTMRG